jgi:hypothetical protein
MQLNRILIFYRINKKEKHENFKLKSKKSPSISYELLLIQKMK